MYSIHFPVIASSLFVFLMISKLRNTLWHVGVLCGMSVLLLYMCTWINELSLYIMYVNRVLIESESQFSLKNFKKMLAQTY